MGPRALPGPGRRVPVSTYRLQLGPQLTFDDVRGRLDHYVQLGVTDLYLSPILQAAPGSTHGYDVVDHTCISDALGGRDAFEALARDAHARSLGIVVDVVPNHMALPTPEYLNPAAWSLLAEGPASPYSSWFDVDWAAGSGRVLLPVLGTQVEDALATGELSLDLMAVPGQGPEERTVLRFYEHVLPVRRGTETLAMLELVAAQHYRLAHWHVADTDLNYRRFFDVTTLAGIRVEDPVVFDATHAVLLELFRDGRIDGFRIDHPDGLADPRQYFERLSEATEGAWVVAEKILEGDEEVPSDWAVAGTTGYDALLRVQALFVDPAGEQPLGDLMRELTGDAPGDLGGMISEAKREIVAGSMHVDVERLASLLTRICAADDRLRVHAPQDLRDCLVALLVAFDRYRAYVVPGEAPSAMSAGVMAEAAGRARAAMAQGQHETLGALVDLLLGRGALIRGGVLEPDRAELVVRFQQLTGPVMAKGIEDTAFYRWTHLVSLCEVGGAPERFGIAPDELHRWAQRIATHAPATMTAGSTHDTKRGEDVRARLGALSQLSAEWTELVGRLRLRTSARRPVGMDGRTESLLWQTLAGTWTEDGPIGAERLAAYLVKAGREAKTWTSWRSPDTATEASLAAFAAYLVSDREVGGALHAWVQRTAPLVRADVLGSKLVQLTLPGVADVYQGTETLVTALVDPDNRGPVEVGATAERLRRLDAGHEAGDLADEKLAVTAAALRLRRAVPGAFVGSRSGYEPLSVSSDHAFAFARTEAGEPRAVTVASRLTGSLDAGGGWRGETVTLPEGAWRNLLGSPDEATVGGGPVRLGRVLGSMPVALLVSSPTG